MNTQKQMESVEITGSKSLQEEFEKLKNIPVVKRKRKVKLVGRASCGCGPSVFFVEREVDYDSPLNDGDNVGEILDTDIFIDE